MNVTRRLYKFCMFSHIRQNCVVEMKMGISLNFFLNFFLLILIKIFKPFSRYVMPTNEHMEQILQARCRAEKASKTRRAEYIKM
jgi:hypothetical protein